MKRPEILYGLILGLLLGILTLVPAPPIVVLVFFVALGVQSAVAAVRVWWRTRLPYLTTALVAGTVVLPFVGVASLATGGFGSRPSTLLLLGLALVDMTLIVVEMRRHRAEWTAWRQAAGDYSVLDVLLVRHIPRIH